MTFFGVVYTAKASSDSTSHRILQRNFTIDMFRISIPGNCFHHRFGATTKRYGRIVQLEWYAEWDIPFLHKNRLRLYSIPLHTFHTLLFKIISFTVRVPIRTTGCSPLSESSLDKCKRGAIPTPPPTSKHRPCSG